MWDSISSTAEASAGSTSGSGGSSGSVIASATAREARVVVLGPGFDRGPRVVEGRDLHQPHVAVVGTLGVLAVVGGHQEELCPALAGAHDLLLDPADRSDGAVGGDLAGPGDPAATGQGAGGEGVVDGQGEHQARARAADPRVDRHGDLVGEDEPLAELD